LPLELLHDGGGILIAEIGKERRHLRRREAQHDESEKSDQRYGDGRHCSDARRTERLGELKKALHRSSPPAHETLSCRTRQDLPSLWLAPG
jgi:hypothetical protein